MKLTIEIPDAIYEAYEKRAVSAEAIPAMMAATVKRFADIPANERCITIWGEDRLALEKIFQTTIDDAKKLHAMLRNTATLKIGVIERIFSPSEVVRLQDQARFHGWSEAQFLELTSNEALDYVFNRL